MLFELMKSGSLPHWWEYVVFVLCVLIWVPGPGAAWFLWHVNRPLRDAWKAVSDSGTRPG